VSTTPFGLPNAAQTFERKMDRTCASLEGTLPYMDDLRFASPDRETHLQHLDKFFAALASNGLAINLEKCVFVIPTSVSVTGLAPQWLITPPK
jgi:hypothetical protein